MNNKSMTYKHIPGDENFFAKQSGIDTGTCPAIFNNRQGLDQDYATYTKWQLSGKVPNYQLLHELRF